MRSNVHYMSLIIFGIALGVAIAWTWVVGCAWLDSQYSHSPFNAGVYWPVTKALGAVAVVSGIVALLTRNQSPQP
jgi:predicted lysophospholipase L1 biosynthesis ABC-type transport system permease subunit